MSEEPSPYIASRIIAATGLRASRLEVYTRGMTAGQARLFRFADALLRGEAPDTEDTREIIKAFCRILDGADPKKALALGGVQSGGRRPKTRAQIILTEMLPVLEVLRHRKEGKVKVEEAIAAVADGFVCDASPWDGAARKKRPATRVSFDVLTKSYKRHRRDVQRLLDGFGGDFAATRADLMRTARRSVISGNAINGSLTLSKNIGSDCHFD